MLQPVLTKYPDCKYSRTTFVGFGTLVCLNGIVTRSQCYEYFLLSLNKGERLRLLLRTFWTLLQHLAVGDIAQRIADVPL